MTTSRRVLHAATIVALLGGGVGGMMPAASAPGAVVLSTNTNYVPGGTASATDTPHVPLTIAQGSDVVYVNVHRGIGHTFSAPGCLPGGDGECLFDSGVLQDGEAAVVALGDLTPGAYAFTCLRHPGLMEGEFTIV